MGEGEPRGSPIIPSELVLPISNQSKSLQKIADLNAVLCYAHVYFAIKIYSVFEAKEKICHANWYRQTSTQERKMHIDLDLSYGIFGLIWFVCACFQAGFPNKKSSAAAALALIAATVVFVTAMEGSYNHVSEATPYGFFRFLGCVFGLLGTTIGAVKRFPQLVRSSD